MTCGFASSTRGGGYSSWYTAGKVAWDEISFREFTLDQGGRFPNLTGKQLSKILTTVCGPPLPGRGKGSHKIFVSPYTQQRITFGYHDGATVTGGIVRKILIKDVGMSLDEARKAVRQ